MGKVWKSLGRVVGEQKESRRFTGELLYGSGRVIREQ